MSKKEKHPTLFNYVALASLIIIILAVIVKAFEDVEKLERAEQAAVSRSMSLAEERLQSYLDLLRGRIEVLSYRNIELIRELFTTGENPAAAERLTETVMAQLPGAFAATVADATGETLVVDFDGLVGDICRDNIRTFAESVDESRIRVHPNPSGYHFDVMLSFADPRDGHEGIFFVSFGLERLARILRESQLPGHELILLFEPAGNLVEVHPNGGRDALGDDSRLTDAALERLMGTRAIEGTHWRLVDLPAQGLMASKTQATFTAYLGYLFLLGMMTFSVVFSIRRERKHLRLMAKANRELEQRVQVRTDELRAADERFRSIIENASDAIITIGTDQKIRLFNPGAERMFGYSADEALGEELSILLPEEARTGHARMVQEFSREPVMARPKHARSEIFGLRKNGNRFPAEATLCKMTVNGETYFTAFVRDVSERKAIEEKVREMAMTDPLTGVANRRYFEIKLQEAMDYADRFGHKVGLLLLDLDDFKPVNDTYGHQAGDEVLKQVAQVLSKSVRKVDVVGRYGGDEFAIIVHGLRKTADLGPLAEKLIERIIELDGVGGESVRIGASVGISVYPDDGSDAEGLLATADEALYSAKRAGKHTHRISAGARHG